MSRPKSFLGQTCRKISVLALAFAAITLTLSSLSQAQTETIIYDFLGGGPLGNPSFPVAGLTLASSGNFYGITQEAGANNAGSVFELSPISGGGWQETPIYSFTGGTDGALPWSSVAIDSAGNLYGISSNGQASNGSSLYGAVYQLSPITGGGWHFTVLHDFIGGLDGGGPIGGLVVDSAGNVFGTSSYFGAGGQGTLFELSPKSGGGWHFTVLHSFTGGTDGGEPYGNLISDPAGNLYGTASQGGLATHCKGGCGVVFKLSPTAGSAWHFSVLNSFTGADGQTPWAGVTRDASGNLFGTTTAGGTDRSGTVFELSPRAGGAWHETLIHSFTDGDDGATPKAGLALDSLGNLYGAAEYGGSSSIGVFFEFSHSSGTWIETVLHTFTGDPDGQDPTGTPIFDSSGNLYGTTLLGGNLDSGSAFEITP